MQTGILPCYILGQYAGYFFAGCKKKINELSFFVIKMPSSAPY